MLALSYERSSSMAARKKGSRKTMKSRAAKIRAGLDHPVVDADGHMLEYAPVFLDFLKQVCIVVFFYFR